MLQQLNDETSALFFATNVYFLWRPGIDMVFLTFTVLVYAPSDPASNFCSMLPGTEAA
jgi:hypothetical protein